MAAKLLLLLCLFSGLHARSRRVEEDENEESPPNQKWVLAPKSQDTDVTLILNKLLREYDRKLRPDIGRHQCIPVVEVDTHTTPSFIGWNFKVCIHCDTGEAVSNVKPPRLPSFLWELPLFSSSTQLYKYIFS
ncbi:Gabrg3 [Phodopus roborovskii]|uniref:Gabrg3 protein n=1 Tax=Phodopus roborovskii TaxID=109678 RepID=A0AAV0AEL8_PHORO|nr:Gabrg3 [Phodopus roborovskii]